MPLAQTITLSTGVQATYWVLDYIKPQFLAGQTEAKLNGYLSSTAFSQGKSSLTDRTYSAPTPGTFNTLTGAQIITAVQNYIKTQPEFIGATDAA